MGKRVKQGGKDQIGKKHTKIQKSTKMPTLLKAKSKCKLPITIPINNQGLQKWLKKRYELIRIKNQAQKKESNNEICGNLKQMLTKQHLLCPVCLETMLKPFLTLCGNYYCENCLQKYIRSSYLCKCKQTLSACHIIKSSSLEVDICQIYLKNLKISQETQWSRQYIMFQELKMLEVVDYQDQGWKRCTIIKINKLNELYTVVLLRMDSLQLTQKIWDQNKFRKTQLLASPQSKEQNRKKYRIMAKRIGEYWNLLQKYSKQNNQRNRYFLYFNIRQDRDKLIKQMQLLKCFPNLNRCFDYDEYQPSSPNTFWKDYNNVNSKWSKWLLYQLFKYEGDEGMSSMVQICKQEQQIVIDLQNQMKDMSIKENQIISQESFLLSVQDSQDSFVSFAQYQKPNSLYNQPYSNGQQRIIQNYLQEQKQFQQFEETYLS